ncbi:methyl-accepting chemotaxis protein [Burkholderia gladioli]|uniref:methyl-accepting chemotaxis protein n=1 Tax=Burkholderia gladioli TaxID=28095 RepID=UPI0016409B22|nr:methyl-accepting chemotaxis protein [Burkholderia gladioli]
MNALFSRFSIRTRLYSTLALAALILCVTGVVGLAGIQNSNEALKDAYASQLAAQTALASANLNLTIVRTTLDRAILHPDRPDLQSVLNKAESYLAISDRAWRDYTALPRHEGEQPLADAVGAARGAFIAQAIQPMIDAMRAGHPEEADHLMMKVSPPLSVALTKATGELDKYGLDRGKAVYDGAQRSFSLLRLVSAGTIVFGLAACLGCAIGLHYAITRPLTRLLEHFRSLSDGDLTHELHWSSRDEMAELVSGVTRMQRNLAETVRRVSRGSESIATATRQISAGNTDLSQRTEEQAAALEQTAASMAELTTTVRQNADHARDARESADDASRIASQGASVVGEVIGTMNDIDRSSQRVADIIGTIEGIAFQTNILALNAAVEAARAGEQGRGFAVVAGEVRTLAQRSATAAKEIRDLIGESVERVAAGSRLVGSAGNTMTEIRNAITRVNDSMAAIAAASDEQRDGIEQVSRAVSQMDQVSQQNAALVEQAAAAAASLEEQADGLRHAVRTFRVAMA